MLFFSVLAADFSRVTNWGYSIPSPVKQYQGNLPKTIFSSRHGLETALRHFVIGRNQYPNIEQIVGTVTGVQRSPSDPTSIEEVTIRTKEGEMTLSAALVVGWSMPGILTVSSYSRMPSTHRLHWPRPRRS